LEDGLLLFKGKIYVPNDPALHQHIVQLHYDSIASGHPGRWKTYELVQRDYWWPGISVFVKNYVDGCATCQATKNNTHPIKPPNQPIITPTKPWSIVTSDFVTDLPKINGLNAINVVVDKFSKAIIITPCRKDITAEETATLFLNNVWKRFGLPDRIILDRGPQFASQVTKGIWKTLGIE